MYIFVRRPRIKNRRRSRRYRAQLKRKNAKRRLRMTGPKRRSKK